MEKPLIAITMGDVAGVGPEIIAKVFLEPELYQFCRPVVIGDLKVFKDQERIPIKTLSFKVITNMSEAKFDFGLINIFNKDNIDLTNLKVGQVNKMCGKAAVEYIQDAVTLALKKEIKAIVTAPISKEAIQLAGFKYNGHTELLAELTKTKNYAMLLVGGTLRVILVTRHLSLKDVAKNLSTGQILEAIELGHQIIKKFGVDAPRIVVCGLNPHIGEGGLLGNEEKEIIIPAVKKAQKKNIKVTGPISSDTAFYLAASGKYDLVIAMYHDQGMIPIKLLAYRRSVNVTIGLPFIRTSPCHGTAFDLAGKWQADATSLLESIKLAARMC